MIVIKSDFICLIFLIASKLFFFSVNSAEQFNFDVTEIEILQNGDVIKGIKKGTISSDDEIEEKKPTVQVGDPFTEKLLLTSGGVKINEVSFKSMESLLCPGLFFSGEVLDVDGITGGFNFQHCWTSGWLAGMAISKLNE